MVQLFDFDLEVKPILEVLVGKTLEQSLMEVLEEEELDTLRDHQVRHCLSSLVAMCDCGRLSSRSCARPS